MTLFVVWTMRLHHHHKHQFISLSILLAGGWLALRYYSCGNHSWFFFISAQHVIGQCVTWSMLLMHGKCTIHIHMYTNIGNPEKAPRKKSHRINYFLNEKNRTVQLDNCFAIFSWIYFKFTAEEKMPWFDAKKKKMLW